MKKLIFAALALAVAVPSFAQRHVDFVFDLEGVHRTGRNTQFSPGTIRFDPTFDNGGGLGAALNFFVSDRVSLEVKGAALRSRLRVRAFGSDYVTVADLGNAQIYPITAIVQWHPLEHGSLHPYLGAGAGHIILRNVRERSTSAGSTGVRFRDPTGLVLDGGVELIVSKRWSAIGDVRYIPLETKARATFVNDAAVEMNVRPLIVGFGVAYHF